MTDKEKLEKMFQAVTIKVIYRGPEQAVEDFEMTGPEFSTILNNAQGDDNE
jgi:hypothetical protein